MFIWFIEWGLVYVGYKCWVLYVKCRDGGWVGVRIVVYFEIEFVFFGILEWDWDSVVIWCIGCGVECDGLF